MDNAIMMIIAAVLVVVAIVGFLVLRIFKSGGKGESIVIVGATNSGKTRLFELLRSNRDIQTFPSMKANIDTFIPYQLRASKRSDNIPCKFIDYPGHGSLRLGLSNHISTARGLLFLMSIPENETAMKQALGNECRFLFNLLMNPILAKNRTPIMIACNTTSHTDITPITKLIQAQITQLRDNQGSMMDLASDNGQKVQLGIEGEPFKFSDSKCPLTISNVCLMEKDVNAVNDWYISL